MEQSTSSISLISSYAPIRYHRVGAYFSNVDAFLQFVETMMLAYRPCALLCVLIPMLLSGCGGDGKDDISRERLAEMAGGKLAETSPVSGVVTVGGAPMADVYLYAHANDEATPVSSCHTDGEGKFCFSSNLLCDGLPVGSYSLTFRLMPDIPKNKDVGPDLFKGKYKSPKKSEVKLTVAAGTPQTELKIDLKK